MTAVSLLTRWIANILVLVHAGLLLWAGIGFLELVFPDPPWDRLSNPLFSESMLLWQWFIISISALVFLIGYYKRWAWTPVLLAGIYALMAFTCTYQTFFILEHESRFTEMIIEFIEYAVILAFLFGAPGMRVHFGRQSR